MWTIVHGPIPGNQVVAHRCNNKGCINVNHLYLTDSPSNSADAARDGLYKTGLNHHGFKITQDLIDEMMRLYNDENKSQVYIAKSFGISQSRVSELIRKGNT